MKAFVVMCSCPAEHQESNKRCPVNRVIYALNLAGLGEHIHDILDIQPIFDHKDVKP